MKLTSKGFAQETQHALSRILVQRFATAVLFAAIAISHPFSTFAQELTPLRESKQKLNNILSFLRADAEIKYFTPGSDFRASFNSMIVAIQPPVSPAKWELMDVSADTPALTDFMKKAIETRLAELGVSEEIALHTTTAELQKLTADCGELRMLLTLRDHEVELDERSVIAVDVRLVSWEGAGVSQRNGKTECLGDNGPPWIGGGSKIFLVERGDRDRALAETKQAILAFVDDVILFRLIASNASARRTVLSLINGEN